MDEPVIQSEISQKEKNKYHMLTHLCNIEKWYLWSYLQGRNTDADTEADFVDTVREEEERMDWQSSTDTYTKS